MSAEAIIDATAWRDSKVICISNVEGIVDLSDANEPLGVRLKSSEIPEAVPRPGQIATFGHSFKAANGQEAHVAFDTEVRTEIEIHESSDALQALATLVGKGCFEVGVLRTRPERVRIAKRGGSSLSRSMRGPKACREGQDENRQEAVSYFL